MMDIYERQRKTFSTVTVLALGSVISLIAAIPVLLTETFTGSLPVDAAIATSAGAGIHLLIYIGFLIGSNKAKLNRRINKEINLVSGIVLLILAFIISDGAIAYLDSLLFVSVCMFICVGCDFAIAIVSVASYFMLRPKKKKKKSE